MCARPCSGFEGAGEVAFEGLKEARGLGDTWNRLESLALLPGGQVVREERARLSAEPISHQPGCTPPGRVLAWRREFGGQTGGRDPAAS